jgi:hypothetical protein
MAVIVFRYKIFGLLLENLSRSLDSSLDIALYPSLSLLTSVTLAYIEKGRTKFSDVGDLPLSGSPSRQGKFLGTAPKVKIFDFYRDGFVEEVKQCFPVLMAVANRVRELLAEWPDHPTLKQVSMRKGSSPNVIRMSKSWRMKWAGHVTQMGPKGNTYRILVGKMDFREIGWNGMNWIDLSQDRDQWRALVNTLMNLQVP